MFLEEYFNQSKYYTYLIRFDNSFMWHVPFFYVYLFIQHDQKTDFAVNRKYNLGILHKICHISKAIIQNFNFQRQRLKVIKRTFKSVLSCSD